MQSSHGELFNGYGTEISYIKNKTNKDAGFKSRVGDILMPTSDVTPYGLATASSLAKDGVRLGGDMNVLRPIEVRSSLYLSHYLNYSQKAIVRLITGAAVKHIYAKDIGSVRVCLPMNLNEQVKIGFFLGVIDKKISLLEQKYEQLVQYKKGIIQQLFSQQLRFKDDNGQDFPDWGKNRLDYLLERTSDAVEVDKTIKYCQIGIRSHGKGIFHKAPVSGEELGDKRVFWVHTKALVLNIVFAWEHAVAVTSDNETGMIASHRFPMYVPKNNRIDLDFMGIFFLRPRGKYLLGIASPGGAGRNKTLGQSNFSELKVTLPCLDEQKKIASFVKSVDQKINLTQQQIKQTQAYKKGLLQQMFV